MNAVEYCNMREMVFSFVVLASFFLNDFRANGQPGAPTDSGDLSAMDAVKSKYQIKRNWNGDPCAKTNTWDGLNCSYTISSSPRITLLSLGSSGLTGEITNAFANLKTLQTLDLSHNYLKGSIPIVLSQLPSLTLLDLTGNQLNGKIPLGLLKKSKDGSLTLRVGDNADLDYDDDDDDDDDDDNELEVSDIISRLIENEKFGIAVAIVVLIVVVVIIYKFRRQKGSFMNTATNPQNTEYSGTSTVDTSIQLKNREFTYKELELITKNFRREIGRGGFGIVYSGSLVDGTQVAVKLRPQASTQGVREFLVEAQHLSRIHHKNLVSLVGYCKDGSFLALVLEYMSQGTLYDHIRGRARGGRPLSWRDRIRIALESAQGLEYLHNGCNPPLIHRDVKPNNILLNAQFEAKIADFGISKAFGSNTDTHVSTNHVVGTLGYVDPEYHMTYQLTEKSDVYSFGVVLLEIITSQPAIVPVSEPQNGSMNIIQWVRQRLSRGNIECVVDARMQGEYDINSVWKAADVALKCTVQNGTQRPTMTEVVVQLKECIELEIMAGRNYGSNSYSENSSNVYITGSYYMEATGITQNSTDQVEHQLDTVPLPSGPAAR